MNAETPMNADGYARFVSFRFGIERHAICNPLI